MRLSRAAGLGHDANMSTTRKSALLTTALLLVALGCSDEPSASGTTGIAGTGGTAAGGGGAGGSGAGGSGAGGSGTNDWSCIGQLPAQEFDTGTVVGNFTVVELQDDAPLADITVRVCSASDMWCRSSM